MENIHECPLCHHEMPEPTNDNEISILGVAAYWLAYLHEKSKELLLKNDEPAVQEQVRQNVNAIIQLISLWH